MVFDVAKVRRDARRGPMRFLVALLPVALCTLVGCATREPSAPSTDFLRPVDRWERVHTIPPGMKTQVYLHGSSAAESGSFIDADDFGITLEANGAISVTPRQSVARVTMARDKPFKRFANRGALFGLTYGALVGLRYGGVGVPLFAGGAALFGALAGAGAAAVSSDEEVVYENLGP